KRSNLVPVNVDSTSREQIASKNTAKLFFYRCDRQIHCCSVDSIAVFPDDGCPCIGSPSRTQLGLPPFRCRNPIDCSIHKFIQIKVRPPRISLSPTVDLESTCLAEGTVRQTHAITSHSAACAEPRASAKLERQH